MIALQIKSMKDFMNKLLASDCFSPFLLAEATICTANTYTIDGHINKEFYPTEEQNPETIPYDFATWDSQKAICFELIKGKHTPTFFQFTLHLKPELVNEALIRGNAEGATSIIKAFVLNIRYNGSQATLTSATSFQTFSMDKEPDKIWDSYLKQFLDSHSLSYEEL